MEITFVKIETIEKYITPEFLLDQSIEDLLKEATKLETISEENKSIDEDTDDDILQNELNNNETDISNYVSMLDFTDINDLNNISNFAEHVFK